MAIGAILERGGKNECCIHWDILADMKDGGEIIYKNGEFII